MSASYFFPTGSLATLLTNPTLSEGINVLANLTNQTVAFNTIPTQTVGATYTLVATASSGLPITYVSTTPAIVAVDGNTATMLSVGTGSITAEQMGNTTYAAASAAQSFAVTGPVATVRGLLTGPNLHDPLKTPRGRKAPRGSLVLLKLSVG